VKIVTKEMFSDPNLVPEELKSFFQSGITDNESSIEQWKI
jgi:hypothetical protein